MEAHPWWLDDSTIDAITPENFCFHRACQRKSLCLIQAGELIADRAIFHSAMASKKANRRTQGDSGRILGLHLNVTDAYLDAELFGHSGFAVGVSLRLR